MDSRIVPFDPLDSHNAVMASLYAQSPRESPHDRDAIWRTNLNPHCTSLLTATIIIPKRTVNNAPLTVNMYFSVAVDGSFFFAQMQERKSSRGLMRSDTCSLFCRKHSTTDIFVEKLGTFGTKTDEMQFVCKASSYRRVSNHHKGAVCVLTAVQNSRSETCIGVSKERRDEAELKKF
ncbi:hypothetical protein WA026_008091 [Henosepilachna vigintioctopunctata]|uniref:Uncharacterized protein n=1 Tax=Henosepilachna vigintioctopunctata TaxID=420089 RepID=A0AAW1TR36_9CUCU